MSGFLGVGVKSVMSATLRMRPWVSGIDSKHDDWQLLSGFLGTVEEGAAQLMSNANGLVKTLSMMPGNL